MDDEVHLPKVQADVKGGLEIGVYRTPTFLVNGQLVDISSGLSALFEATERAVGKARGSNMLLA
jgi:protein-disulfide isomerase